MENCDLGVKATIGLTRRSPSLWSCSRSRVTEAVYTRRPDRVQQQITSGFVRHTPSSLTITTGTQPDGLPFWICQTWPSPSISCVVGWTGALTDHGLRVSALFPFSSTRSVLTTYKLSRSLRDVLNLSLSIDVSCLASVSSSGPGPCGTDSVTC
ncbi:hypothetical protein RRG08_022656 [Elysia crispata]|uniref:Uncharacterized protein n=1 Tax=Elysia crispata TaxID=231223 RepID=A0AAE0Z1X5_9GAST|nr:hypothetical protein RRG08_022656 [Elysia crispata]